MRTNEYKIITCNLETEAEKEEESHRVDVKVYL